ncbi:MAG: GxxExxY protein [Bacteroidetes bacterium]|nr:GxxExxY protein [Bacteroidota bacterium]
MHENEISYLIRGAIFKVYNELGAGLLESVYEKAMAYQLIQDGCEAQSQVPVAAYYNGIKLEDIGFRADLIVNQKVLIEIKSVEALHDVHFKQVTTYLKLTGLKLGILVNFSTASIDKEIHRIVNRL